MVRFVYVFLFLLSSIPLVGTHHPAKSTGRFDDVVIIPRPVNLQPYLTGEDVKSVFEVDRIHLILPGGQWKSGHCRVLGIGWIDSCRLLLHFDQLTRPLMAGGDPEEGKNKWPILYTSWFRYHRHLGMIQRLQNIM
jgi:hypothetical protein